MNYNDILLEIELDQEWRLLEFEKIQTICQKASEDEVKIILKSSIPLIYAHWEGFVVQSLRVLHRWLSSFGYSFEQFDINILTVSYEEHLKNLVHIEEYDRKKKHLEIILDKINQNVEFCPKIDVKSNVNFKIIKNEICQKYNFEIDNFTCFQKDLDSFLNIRNKIAHGELMVGFDNYEDIQKYVVLLSDLMATLYAEIESFCVNKKYLRTTN